MKKSLLLLALLTLPLAQAWAQDEDQPAGGMPDEETSTPAEVSAASAVKGKFPRFASIKKSEVNVRSGPGNQYPILWIYERTGYPVQLLTRYDNYYKVRDAEGEEGWVYITMISSQHTALVGSVTPTPVFKSDDAGSAVIARFAPGLNVLMKDDTCPGERCKVEAGGYKGWVAKKDLLMVE